MRKGRRSPEAIARATAVIQRVNASGMNIRRPYDHAMRDLRRITALQPQTEALAKRIYALLDGEGIGHIRPADHIAVELLAVLLRRIAQADASLDEFGLIRRKSEEVRPIFHVLIALLKEARGYIDTLGLSPKARAALGLDTARALDAYEELERLREGRAPPDAPAPGADHVDRDGEEGTE